jgi:hypothetical protein
MPGLRVGWDGTKKIVPLDELSRIVPWDGTILKTFCEDIFLRTRKMYDKNMIVYERRLRWSYGMVVYGSRTKSYCIIYDHRFTSYFFVYSLIRSQILNLKAYKT